MATNSAIVRYTISSEYKGEIINLKKSVEMRDPSDVLDISIKGKGEFLFKSLNKRN